MTSRSISTVTRRLSLSLICSVAIFGATAVAGIILARELGPSLRGEFATIILWPTLLVALGSLGFVEATTYVVANGRLPFAQVVGTSLAVAALQSIAMVALGFGMIELIFGSSAVPKGPFQLNLLSIPIGLIGTYALAALNGRGRQRLFQLGRTIGSVLACILIIGLAAIDELTISTAVGAYLIGAAVMAVFAISWTVSIAGVCDLRFRREAFSPLMSFGLRSYVSSIPIQLNYRVDQLLISAFMQPIQLGLYVTAATTTYLTQLVGSSIQVVALPTVAAAKSTAEVVRLARTYLRWCLVVTVLLTIPLFVLLPQLVEILFGSDFEGAVVPGRILLVGTIALSVRSVLDGLLKGVGRPLAVGVAEGSALIFTLAALPFALHFYGIEGAAWVSLAGYLLSAFVMAIQFARATGVRGRSLFFGPAPAVDDSGDTGPQLDVAHELSAESSTADELAPGGERW